MSFGMVVYFTLSILQCSVLINWLSYKTSCILKINPMQSWALSFSYIVAFTFHILLLIFCWGYFSSRRGIVSSFLMVSSSGSDNEVIPATKLVRKCPHLFYFSEVWRDCGMFIQSYNQQKWNAHTILVDCKMV